MVVAEAAYLIDRQLGAKVEASQPVHVHHRRTVPAAGLA
jgi:hypothetical protein